MLAIHRLPHRIFFGIFFIYKNLHIEPFNYSIKTVCFDFRSTNVGSSVINTGRSEGSLLPYFYRFWCHYPSITYLSIDHKTDKDLEHCILFTYVCKYSSQYSHSLYGNRMVRNCNKMINKVIFLIKQHS